MSTRCTIHFERSGHTRDYASAIIFRHGDGYPDGRHGVLANLEEFFSEIESQTKETYFGNPSYLAAKFVVWQAGEYENFYLGKERTPLDFSNVGIVLKDPTDISYRYHIKCDTDKKRPTVTYERE